MSNLTKFEFKDNQVRVTTIDGEPWFVAADVCKVLQIARTDSVVRDLYDDEKGTLTMSTPGGNQEMIIVSEPGLYQLVFKSRKPQAKAFRRWLSHEVIPSIRKTGSYSVNGSNSVNSPKESLIKEAGVAINTIFDKCGYQKELLAGLKLNAAQKISPGIAEAIEPCRQYLINGTANESCLMTVTELGKKVEKSGQTVNKLLIEQGFQIKNPKKGKKEPTYLPTDKGKEFGSMTAATGKGNDNTTYQQLRWYESILNALIITN